MTARNNLMDRRYAPAPRPHKPKRIALWYDDCGRWILIRGHASMHRTRGGCLNRLRLRLVKRFGLSAFRVLSSGRGM